MPGCSLAEWRDNLESPTLGFIGFLYGNQGCFTRIKGHLLIREMMRKKMNRKFLVTTIVTLFGLVGIQSTALAIDYQKIAESAPRMAVEGTCPDRDERTLEDNTKYYNSGWALVREAVAAAEAGDATLTKDRANRAMLDFKCMVNVTFGSTMQRITSPVRKANLYAKKAIRAEKKGDTETATKKLTEALAQLNESLKRSKNVSVDNVQPGMCFSCLVGGKRKGMGEK
jgi:hypothetical protein